MLQQLHLLLLIVGKQDLRWQQTISRRSATTPPKLKIHWEPVSKGHREDRDTRIWGCLAKFSLIRSQKDFLVTLFTEHSRYVGAKREISQ